MRHEIKVPTVGESIQEVQIGKWLKSQGQWANKDESLVEIESDKATVDVAAPVPGIVAQVLHGQGDVVPVGTLIAYLEEAPRPDGGGAPAATGAPAAAAGRQHRSLGLREQRRPQRQFLPRRPPHHRAPLRSRPSLRPARQRSQPRPRPRPRQQRQHRWRSRPRLRPPNPSPSPRMGLPNTPANLLLRRLKKSAAIN